MPSWQDAQPATMPAWVNVAGIQASVEWQVLHASPVGTWFVPLPVAMAPSWQLAQAPVTWV